MYTTIEQQNGQRQRVDSSSPHLILTRRVADLEEDPLQLRLSVSQLERELHLGVVARVADDLLDRVLVLRLGKLVSVDQNGDQFTD